MRTPKPKLVKIDMALLRSYNPCYDPSKFLPETFKGTVIDILKHKEIPPQDKLWVVCRKDLLNAGLLRQFAVAQAKSVRKYIATKDRKKFDRILKVCLRFSKGKAIQDELDAARNAAESAAESAAWNAAWNAARSAAEGAAWNAAWNAARSAAESAAWSAARSAAESAARNAAESAARSAAEGAARNAAWNAAWNAVGNAAESAACKLLLKMIRASYAKETK